MENIDTLKSKAISGNIDSIISLGNKLIKGENVEKNIENGIKLLQFAIEKGSAYYLENNNK